mmetsp:Transcript_7157/g.17362  ORF Transcript_7157/g.17362 Transcript_7157/m.17362 type:complete len:259 (+) Transcript_7157:130-906(+)
MSDAAKERSRLLNRQKDERSAVEKQLKKAKGAMKEKAETELQAMEERHTQELAALDGGGEATAAGSADKKPEKIKIFEDRQWDSYSKKELEEACQERGLGKKGAKDDLVMKLISFHQDQAKRIEQNPELVEQSGKAKGGNAKAGKDTLDSDDEEDSDEEEDETDSDEDEDAKKILDVTPEEAEKQFKREQHVRKALRHVLLKSGPFALEELPKAMEAVVKGFTPEILGYTSLRQFAKNQPKRFMRFDKKENMCNPPKE